MAINCWSRAENRGDGPLTSRAAQRPQPTLMVNNLSGKTIIWNSTLNSHVGINTHSRQKAIEVNEVFFSQLWHCGGKRFFDFLLLTNSWLTVSQRQSEPARGPVVSRCRIQTKLPVFPFRCCVYMRKQDCKYPTWMLWNQGKTERKKMTPLFMSILCFDGFLNWEHFALSLRSQRCV